MTRKSRDVPHENKAVATGFKNDSVEGEVRTILERTIEVSGMKEVQYTITCPAKPITHAFLEFRYSDERDRYVRSANMQQIQLNRRKIKISPAMDADERFHHQRMGLINYALHDKHKIPYTK